MDQHPDGWLRCQLSIHVVLRPSMLRLLHNYWKHEEFTGLPKDGKELYETILKLKEDKRNKKKFDKICPDQNDILTPDDSGQIDSNAFDPTLIHFLLKMILPKKLKKYSKASNKKHNVNQMSPLEKNIYGCAQAIHFRNRESHPKKLHFTKHEFTQRFEQIKDILENLGTLEIFKPLIVELEGGSLAQFHHHSKNDIKLLKHWKVETDKKLNEHEEKISNLYELLKNTFPNSMREQPSSSMTSDQAVEFMPTRSKHRRISERFIQEHTGYMENNNIKVINRDAYCLGENKSTGSHVCLANHGHYGWVALKRTRLASEVVPDFLRSVHHPRISCYFETFCDDYNTFFVMEVLEENIKSYLRTSRIDTNTIDVDLYLQVLQAIEFLHFNGIVHGNLKPENILVTISREIKVADFGIKQHNVSHGSSTEKIAISDWLSYNQLKEYGTHYTSTNNDDIFTLVLLMYYFRTFGRHPLWEEYPSTGFLERFSIIENCKLLNHVYDKKLNEVIENMLRKIMDNDLTITDIKEIVLKSKN